MYFMNDKNSDQRLARYMTEKSREAFVMGLEIFNKPTLKYRVEGFAFFICNAWELLLKAVIVHKSGNKSIYYKDNPDRTISLSDAAKRVFTNEKDPLRKNLEKIPFECAIKSKGEKRNIFNKTDLILFIKFYDLKNDKNYSYAHKTDGRKATYSYSPKIVDFIVEHIRKDPTGVIQKLKNGEPE